MYMFLIERAHALRAPYRRLSDWVWLTSTAVIILGLGCIAVVSFIFPVAEISTKDRICRIGLPLKVTIPLLALDFTTIIGMTAVFIYLLWPLLRFNSGQASIRSYWLKSIRSAIPMMTKFTTHSANHEECSNAKATKSLEAIEQLAWKSLVGALLVLVPTIGNLSLLLHTRGRELGWLCFTICTLDSKYSSLSPSNNSISNNIVFLSLKMANFQQLPGRSV